MWLQSVVSFTRDSWPDHIFFASVLFTILSLSLSLSLEKNSTPSIFLVKSMEFWSFRVLYFPFCCCFTFFKRKVKERRSYNNHTHKRNNVKQRQDDTAKVLKENLSSLHDKPLTFSLCFVCVICVAYSLLIHCCCDFSCRSWILLPLYFLPLLMMMAVSSPSSCSLSSSIIIIE